MKNKQFILYQNINQEICFASENGHASAVEVLLKDPRVDPSAQNNYAIRYASQNGHASTVEVLLRHEYKKIVENQNTKNLNFIFCIALEYGFMNIVEDLLKHPDFDPSDNTNYALYLASKHGHASAVKELLKDSRVNPSDYYNCAISSASRNGHISVVEELLKDKRVDPSDYDNAIFWAFEYGHMDVVKLTKLWYKIKIYFY